MGAKVRMRGYWCLNTRGLFCQQRKSRHWDRLLFPECFSRVGPDTVCQHSRKLATLRLTETPFWAYWNMWGMLSLVRVLGRILIHIHSLYSILANGEGQCALRSGRVTHTSPSLGTQCDGTTLSRNNGLRRSWHAHSTPPESGSTQIAYKVVCKYIKLYCINRNAEFQEATEKAQQPCIISCNATIISCYHHFIEEETKT